MDAGVLVEGNYFEGVRYPTETVFGDWLEPGRLVERDNIYVDCQHQPQSGGAVKESRDAYTYTLDKAADVPELVKRGAGVGGTTTDNRGEVVRHLKRAGPSHNPSDLVAKPGPERAADGPAIPILPQHRLPRTRADRSR